MSCPLTALQFKTLTLAAEGITETQIASQLGCTRGAVARRLTVAYRTLGVNNRADAIRRACQEGWLAVPAEQLDALGEFPLSLAQREYLDRFDRYLRAPSIYASEEARDQMSDQLDVVLQEAGVDRAYVPHARDKEAA